MMEASATTRQLDMADQAFLGLIGIGKLLDSLAKTLDFFMVLPGLLLSYYQLLPKILLLDLQVPHSSCKGQNVDALGRSHPRWY